MIHVTKKNSNEPSRSLIQRFSRRVRSSGLLRAVRNKRFFERKPNRRRRRESAIVREQRRKRYEWMKKRGLLE